MGSYKVRISYERDVEFYVEAESRDEVVAFLDTNPDWQPGDVDGLIDFVGEEQELSYDVEPSSVVANFEIVAGKLKEKA